MSPPDQNTPKPWPGTTAGPIITLDAPAVCAVSGRSLESGAVVRRDLDGRIYDVLATDRWNFRPCSGLEYTFHSDFQLGIDREQVRNAMLAGWELVGTAPDGELLHGGYNLSAGFSQETVTVRRSWFSAGGAAFPEWWERVGKTLVAWAPRLRRPA